MRRARSIISKIILTALVLLPCWAFGATGTKNDITGLLQEGEADIRKWNVSGASEIADKALGLAKTDEEKHDAYYLKAVTEYYKGNYAAAGEYAGNALKTGGSPRNDEDDGFMDFIEYSVGKKPAFKELKSEHFTIRYSHPEDYIIAEYGKDVLEKARYEIGLDLEEYPEEPVIVEIYPDLESFTTASTLPPENVEKTGVVGICKFNRVMVLSPRLLPKGYAWSDTLAHEYTHYLIFLKSENTVPVWLHEGIAKFEESRWRESKRNVLSPFYETILAQALKNNSLVPIEKMHPSLALLDSAREAQLAFAQAGTSVSFLVDRWGNDGLVGLLQAMKARDDYKAAITEVTGLDFDTFYASWKKYLAGKNLTEKIPGIKVKGIRISKNDGRKEDGSEDLVDIDNSKARGYTRLGDLLGSRGRLRSASYEYEKALGFDPGSPLISTRLASALNASGEVDRALGILDPLLEFYPENVDIHIVLGRIYLERGNLSKAEESYLSAVSINPFDPEVHTALAAIYDKQGRTQEAERERKVLDILAKKDGQNE
ncbi:MAG TPA: tetratricopeptide repeat protein [Thermodesulfobacteriota bacterium]|nr:tetratricopeptide repeat protein [Thermodesulfobacteriota bacterium]